MRCSFRCFDIPKHFCLLSPNIPSIVLSGVKNCLFSGSWELVVEYMVLEFLAEEIKYLQVLLLEVRPQLLDHLGPRHLQKVPMWKRDPRMIIAHLFSLFGANDLSQLGGDVEGHLQPSQLLLGLLSHVGWFKVGIVLNVYNAVFWSYCNFYQNFSRLLKWHFQSVVGPPLLRPPIGLPPFRLGLN